MLDKIILVACFIFIITGCSNTLINKQNAQLGTRPYYLINDMDAGDLKAQLESCSEGPFLSHRLFNWASRCVYAVP